MITIGKTEKKNESFLTFFFMKVFYFVLVVQHGLISQKCVNLNKTPMNRGRAELQPL